MQNTRFCLQQEGQATEKKISLPEGVACSEGWLEGPRKWVRFGGLLQALWINKCKPGTLFVFFFQGVPTQSMGLGFPLDTQGLWFRVTEESQTYPLVGMALPIYVRVGTPLVESKT